MHARSVQGFAQASYQGAGNRNLVGLLLHALHRSLYCLMLAHVVKDGVSLMHAAVAVSVCHNTVFCASKPRPDPFNFLLQVGQHRPAVKGDLGKEEVDFAAAANAKVVKDAEEYYREGFATSALCCHTLECISRAAAGTVHAFSVLHVLTERAAIIVVWCASIKVVTTTTPADCRQHVLQRCVPVCPMHVRLVL